MRYQYHLFGATMKVILMCHSYQLFGSPRVQAPWPIIREAACSVGQAQRFLPFCVSAQDCWIEVASTDARGSLAIRIGAGLGRKSTDHGCSLRNIRTRVNREMNKTWRCGGSSTLTPPPFGLLRFLTRRRGLSGP